MRSSVTRSVSNHIEAYRHNDAGQHLRGCTHLNVQTTSCHISGDQSLHFSFFHLCARIRHRSAMQAVPLTSLAPSQGYTIAAYLSDGC